MASKEELEAIEHKMRCSSGQFLSVHCYDCKKLGCLFCGFRLHRVVAEYFKPGAEGVHEFTSDDGSPYLAVTLCCMCEMGYEELGLIDRLLPRGKDED